jgi:hypothetical protein
MKTTLRYNFLFSREAQIRKYDNTFCWQSCGELFFYIDSRNKNWYNPLQGNLRIPNKTTLTRWLLIESRRNWERETG